MTPAAALAAGRRKAWECERCGKPATHFVTVEVAPIDRHLGEGEGNDWLVCQEHAFSAYLGYPTEP